MFALRWLRLISLIVCCSLVSLVSDCACYTACRPTFWRWYSVCACVSLWNIRGSLFSLLYVFVLCIFGWMLYLERGSASVLLLLWWFRLSITWPCVCCPSFSSRVVTLFPLKSVCGGPPLRNNFLLWWICLWWLLKNQCPGWFVQLWSVVWCLFPSFAIDKTRVSVW